MITLGIKQLAKVFRKLFRPELVDRLQILNNQLKKKGNVYKVGSDRNDLQTLDNK